METLPAPVPIDRWIPRFVLDRIFCGYYVFQLISTPLLDMQGTLPTWLYPSWMRAFFTHHLETWRDPWLADTRAHPWYFGIVFWEYLVQMPFFFVASYAYYKGAQASPWIRIPVIMYCTQTITAVTGIIFMALFEDFNDYTALAPTSTFQRLKLAFIYSFFLVISFLNLYDTLFSKVYLGPSPQAPGTPVTPMTEEERNKREMKTQHED
ncbi:hypothetical protein C0Q70_07138 [Pomacea canaliculata]|uniref:EXPERA domain-containing protein n=2 Tax=Pomacea canaliculata TaxID=400727 RepID=A0A2T7PE77_POMCA|nr:sigma intracellular receptor 2-like isoform X2 [Pomacea canaliculata]XP_025091823.1 sigma intracellular receptor 2-like isoform X2 [Pomacea canaliculata]XP_025091824.1 sigma intracellular receptor 2-like isoform X2 [Pomacea canaliculata]XP_025091825.1 sigma intracellular receptor 2-like isoform X2 [Pomacea canaliculata]XP_025091826.1 sigma intracellular receptor 2-like isoform X2 [Pomacea canaliculata]XP_025091827.1 sigma intracellular receptor 2-like isoform X2 [Pomacea canaliculata]XP_02